MHEKIALTGGRSFLNTLLLQRLTDISQIKEIHVCDIKAPKITANKIIFHRIDLTKDNASSNLANVLISNKITQFIHGALFSGPSRRKAYHHEVESIGTFHVLNAVAEANIQHLIVQSHSFVYGAHPKNPNFIPESFSLRPQRAQFVNTRVDVERQIQEFIKDYPECNLTVLRFAPIIGPNASDLRARYFIAKILPRVLGYDPLLQFIHEEDAIDAQILAIFNPQQGIFNIASKGVLSLSTAMHLAGKIPLPFIATACKSIFSAGFSLRLWDLPAEMVPFFQYLCVCDIKKAEKELNFIPKYSSRQALKSMIETHRLQHVGFPMPSSILGEEKESTEKKAFTRIF